MVDLDLLCQTPRTVRALFKDPCIRLSAEVSKALKELAESIRSRRQCSPEILSDHLHQSLSDLNTALKSQPRLFLGPNTNQSTNNILANLAAADATAPQKLEKHFGPSSKLSSFKTDSSALIEWKSRRASEQAKENERKVLRPTLSKIAIMSLEFSEALPFAAFASLLVETVARLAYRGRLGNIIIVKYHRRSDFGNEWSGYSSASQCIPHSPKLVNEEYHSVVFKAGMA